MATKKESTLIIGVGGTGSYFIKNLVHYLNSTTTATNKHILVIDGDVIEAKNLLRQGFYRNELGQPKATSISDRLQPILADHVTLEADLQFLATAQQIVTLMTEGIYADSDSYTIVSCVDNNMARLRMLIGMYMLHEVTGKEVRFLDSGNTEWTGQSLVSVLKARSKKTYLHGLYKSLITSVESLQSYEMKANDITNILYNQFTPNDNWIANLTKGEHELSCDDVTVSNPQNVATNMSASNVLLMMYDRIFRNIHNGGEYTFNAKTSTFLLKSDSIKEENGYLPRLVEILDYIKSPIGFKEVFGDVSALYENTTSVPNFEATEVTEEIVEETVETVTEEPTTIEENTLNKPSEEETFVEIELVPQSVTNEPTELDSITKDITQSFDDFLNSF